MSAPCDACWHAARCKSQRLARQAFAMFMAEEMPGAMGDLETQPDAGAELRASGAELRGDRVRESPGGTDAQLLAVARGSSGGSKGYQLNFIGTLPSPRSGVGTYSACCT